MEKRASGHSGWQDLLLSGFRNTPDIVSVGITLGQESCRLPQGFFW
jgi:hypothetical protein